MNERNIAIELIAFMAHVEGIAEENRLVPPIEVNATDQDGRGWNFEYSPDWDSLDIVNVTPKLPLSLRLRDANGNIVETAITNLNLRPEWLKRFVQ